MYVRGLDVQPAWSRGDFREPLEEAAGRVHGSPSLGELSLDSPEHKLQTFPLTCFSEAGWRLFPISSKRVAMCETRTLSLSSSQLRPGPPEESLPQLFSSSLSPTHFYKEIKKVYVPSIK